MAEQVDLGALAVFRRRVAGETRVIALTGGDKPLLVKVEVPNGFTLAIAEAAAQEAIQTIRANAQNMVVYGFDPQTLTDQELMALSKIIIAVETAKIVWKDWNYSIVDDAIQIPVKAPITPQNISSLMLDPDIRAAWSVQLDSMSPLERAEGNVSAVLPTTDSDKAAIIADDASN